GRLRDRCRLGTVQPLPAGAVADAGVRADGGGAAVAAGGPAGPGGGAGVKRWVLLGIGLAVVLALPWFVYPPVASDIVAFALLAIALDLLIGFTGLLSFGHAAFWGTAAYATGLVAIHAGVPFPVAVLAGALAAAVLAVPIGYLSVKR